MVCGVCCFASLKPIKASASGMWRNRKTVSRCSAMSLERLVFFFIKVSVIYQTTRHHGAKAADEGL